MPMQHSQTLFQRLQTRRKALTLSSGMLSGVILICAMTPVRLMLGTNQEVDAAMILTAAISCWLSRNWSPETEDRGRWYCGALPAAAAWSLILPSLLVLLLKWTSYVPLDTLQWSLVAFATTLGMTMACLSPVFYAVSIAQLTAGSRTHSTTGQWLVGLGISCLVIPTLVLPYAGTTILGWIALVISAIWVALRISLPTEATSDETPLAATAEPVGWLTTPAALATGAALALTAYIAGQLIPRNLMADMALLAGLVAGMGIALARRAWRPTARFRFSPSIVLLALAAWTGLMTAGYPLWTQFCLRINAWVDHVGILFALRIGFLMFLALPAGFLVRRLAGATGSSSSSPAVLLLIAIGFITARAIPCSPQTIAAGLVSIAMCLTFLAWAGEQFRLPSKAWQKLGTVALVGIAVTGLLFSRNLDPRQSERLLYSGFALDSYRQGLSASQLNWLDDSRPLAEFASLTDRFSLWKQRGSQVVLRHNGMVMGLHSSRPDICPHQAGDLLPVLLPLTLHPHPENVLVMGIHPPSLLTCQTWPLRSVQSVDGSGEAHRMLQWMRTQPTQLLNLEQGPDFRFTQVDPVRSVYSSHPTRYDLIACPITHPSATGAASQLTREFYTGIRSHLSEDGIFSQRLPYYDLGPTVICEVTSTLQQVFGDVRVVESIPGELIFLCSPRSLPSIDDSFAERLKLPQVRTLLGQAGWDWSLILGRGAIDHAGLKEMVAKHHHVNGAAHSWLTYRLPIEISRWGRKADQTREILAKHGDALRASLGESACGKEVTERLEDLNLAHQIQRDHPNDPWAYRAALKSRLQDRPRATIMPVNHELKRVMDPEDQRRKDYLLALGPAAKNPRPSPEAVAQLAEFEAPFDPLVSLFVYSETAHLLGRCEPAQPALHLHHLLHTVYFSSGYDQSVRNVSEALLQLCRNPELASSEQARWDEMNSLMQTLAQRWQLRIGSGKISKYEVVDTEESLRAVESALKELERHHRSAGLSDAQWSMRKQTLEQALVRPLQQHRSLRARDIPLAPVVPSGET
ncbi:hypothetical protein SH661x_000572 [Planctomicrobium sp. SH661]|uniref:hypothetical protein n=1 Tax=Planctomicrobium sp. SH661 TaxID=3448124 RepID=UPI003F5CA900